MYLKACERREGWPIWLALSFVNAWARGGADVTHSRTGTAEWKRLAKRVRWRCRVSEGQTQCPFCSVVLNWKVAKLPNSAEVDHIMPSAMGGTDDESNLWVICRRCNQSKGKRSKPARIQHGAPLRNSGRW